ncbi:MAG: hypothetical protein SVO26_08300 [Chloroflexota bacterium]|nr:hypothetical protein [Chloroflexota bacterium]
MRLLRCARNDMMLSLLRKQESRTHKVLKMLASPRRLLPLTTTPVNYSHTVTN